MGNVELGLEVELYCGVFLAIAGLPPGHPLLGPVIAPPSTHEDGIVQCASCAV